MRLGLKVISACPTTRVEIGLAPSGLPVVEVARQVNIPLHFAGSVGVMLQTKVPCWSGWKGALYFSKRSCFDYSFPVYCPNLEGDIKDVERLQWLATRKVTGFKGLPCVQRLLRHSQPVIRQANLSTLKSSLEHTPWNSLKPALPAALNTWIALPGSWSRVSTNRVTTEPAVLCQTRTATSATPIDVRLCSAICCWLFEHLKRWSLWERF